MKNYRIIFLFILAIGFSNFTKAQYCSTFAMSKDMVLTYQNHNAKGLLTTESITTCYDIVKDSSGANIYKVEIEVNNADGINLSLQMHEMKCINGKLFVDFESYTELDEMKEFSGMTIDVETEDIEYPEVLNVNQELPDALITISTIKKGKKKKSYVAKMTNRKVVSSESITVPVGTFDCFKITYDLEMQILTNKKYKVIEYISEGIGQIKTETYNKKGKLKSYSVLTGLKK